jgi:CheY-like chemotaxis protein
MGGQRVLVVEDYRPLLAGIRGILEAEGYTVSAATDGVQALRVMEEDIHPDLIISDILMPRMDGYAFYEAIRARPEWPFIPFIFLTVKAEEGDVLKGKTLGVEDYITKPFGPQELVVAVRAWLERARATRWATKEELEQPELS